MLLPFCCSCTCSSVAKQLPSLSLFSCQRTFFFIPSSVECYTQQDCSPGKVIYFGDEVVCWLFIVANGNLRVEFYNAIFKFWLIHCVLIRTTMSAVLYVVMNSAPSLSAEKTKRWNYSTANFSTHRCLCAHVPSDLRR